MAVQVARMDLSQMVPVLSSAAKQLTRPQVLAWADSYRGKWEEGWAKGSFGLMGFSSVAGVTVNQQDENFGQSHKCAHEASTTRLCPIRGKLVGLVLCVRQRAQRVRGQSVERKSSERLITLRGSFIFNLQRQTLSPYWKEAVSSTRFQQWPLRLWRV